MAFSGANALMGDLPGQFDGHAHVFKTELAMAEDRRYTPAYDATPETYTDLLRSHQLDGALLVQPSFLGSDNSFLMKTLNESAKHQDLVFRGVCVVTPDTKLAELNRLEKAGIVGIRLNLLKRTDQFNIETWEPVLKKTNKLGWHVEIQCEGMALPRILVGVSRLCETIVIDHFGLPNPFNNVSCPGLDAILALPRDRVFVKTSAPYRMFKSETSQNAAERCQPIADRLVNHLGTDRLVWGSDWPWTQFENRHTYRDTLDWLNNWEDRSGAN